jgi:hypothetical protein
MLLRNELQTALQDVEVGCLEVADGHDAAAETLADDPLAATLRELAEARRTAAERLAERIREEGDLPGEPDADLETARDLASRVLAALSGDQHHTLAAERAAAEGHLATLAATALDHLDVSPRAQTLIEQIRRDASAAQQRLAEH